MDDDTIFRLLLLAATTCGVAVRLYYQRRAERLGGTVRRASEPLTTWLGLGLLLPLVLVPLLGFLVNPAWLEWGRLPLARGVRWTGAALLLAGIPLLLWMFRHLDTNLTRTAGVRERAHLITSGPYRWIRHPLYAFGWLTWLGAALMTASWLILIGLALLLPLLLATRIPHEEANLVARFGDEYRAYASRTGRLLPRFSRGGSASR